MAAVLMIMYSGNKMKPIRTILAQNWILITTIIIAGLILTNIWFTYRIKSGLRELAEKLKNEDVSGTDVFYRVGPATADALKSVTRDDYSISIWPLDCGIWESLSVTHTAFVKSKEMEIALRIRFNIFDGYFHIVGFYTVRYKEESHQPIDSNANFSKSESITK